MKPRNPFRRAVADVQPKAHSRTPSIFPDVPKSHYTNTLDEAIATAEICIKLAMSDKPPQPPLKLLNKASEKLDNALFACAKLKDTTKRKKIAALQTTIQTLEKSLQPAKERLQPRWVTQQMLDEHEKYLTSLHTQKRNIETYLNKRESVIVKIIDKPVNTLTSPENNLRIHAIAQMAYLDSVQRRIVDATNEWSVLHIEFELCKDRPQPVTAISPTLSSKTSSPTFFKQASSGDETNSNTPSENNSKSSSPGLTHSSDSD